MNFKIRKSDNVGLVRSLHRDCFPGDDFYDHDGNQYWIAWNDKEPIGFTMLTIMDENIGFLSRSGVLPNYRGNGLQRRFIRVREMFARKNDLKNIITYTKIHNISSSRSIQKCGYDLYIPEYEYADKDCLYWIKVI